MMFSIDTKVLCEYFWKTFCCLLISGPLECVGRLGGLSFTLIHEMHALIIAKS